jgi:transcription elongation factor GreA
MKKIYQLTVAGKVELEAELERLKSQRGAIAQKIADARDFGDLRENAEYDAARTEQSQVESRIAEIEEILLNASIISDNRKTTKVSVGNTVSLKADNGKKVAYTIVGSVEADPLAGRISDESPIGQALLGKKVGEIATIATPKGEVSYTVAELR